MSKATGGIGAGGGAVEYYNPRNKLNIDQAARLLAQRGYKLGSPSYIPGQKATTYKITKGKTTREVSTKEIKKMLIKK
jgi:hypothetical protein